MTSEKKQLKQLQLIFNQLPPKQQQTLLEFAQFLESRVVTKPILTANPLPRPPSESVIAAIKRLAQSYPMLDKAKMLDETSRLMSEHIMQGRDKIEVIDELEAIFLQYYNNFKNEETK
jgi:hypothetical protein